jgi:hypothetical protein
MGVLVLLTLTVSESVSTKDEGDGDLAAYQAITDRMRDGEGYYQAAHHELLARGYGTQSVFNWRTPLHPEALALAPSDGVAALSLAALAVAIIALAAAVVARWQSRAALMTFGLAAACCLITLFIPGPVFFAEVVAGVLILAAVSCAALGHTRVSIASGLLALFVRELAGVYVVIALAIALRGRRWREVAAWGLGLVAYGAYFGWHRAQVLAEVSASDPAYDEGWVQFGGFEFVLRTAQMNGLFLALPLVVTAVVLPLALVGLLAWEGPGGSRAALTVFAYVALFCVVGKPDNIYWGALYTPLLIFGLALSPWALRDLATRATLKLGPAAGARDLTH